MIEDKSDNFTLVFMNTYTQVRYKQNWLCI